MGAELRISSHKNDHFMAHICLKSHNGGSHCLHNSTKVNVKKTEKESTNVSVKNDV